MSDSDDDQVFPGGSSDSLKIFCPCGFTGGFGNLRNDCTQSGLSNHWRFPPYVLLPHETDVDDRYYCCGPCGVHEPCRHWCVVGEVLSLDVIGRPRVTLRDRFGQKFVVHFHFDSGRFAEPTFFRWADVQRCLSKNRKGTMLILYAYEHEFLDGSCGLRVESEGVPMFFPVPFEQLDAEIRKLADSPSTDAEEHVVVKMCCAACGKSAPARDSLPRCTKCKTVRYCGRACQEAHWASGGHKALCPHMAMLTRFARFDLDSWTCHQDWSWALAPEPREVLEKRYCEQHEEAIYRMTGGTAGQRHALRELLGLVRGKTLESVAQLSRNEGLVKAIAGTDNNGLRHHLTSMMRGDAASLGAVPIETTFLFRALDKLLDRSPAEQAGADHVDRQTIVVDWPTTTGVTGVGPAAGGAIHMAQDALYNLVSILLVAVQQACGKTRVRFLFENDGSVLNGGCGGSQTVFVPEQGWKIKQDEHCLNLIHDKSGTVAFWSSETPIVAGLAEDGARAADGVLFVRVLRSVPQKERLAMVKRMARGEDAYGIPQKQSGIPKNLLTVWIRESPPGVFGGRYRAPLVEGDSRNVVEKLSDIDFHSDPVMGLLGAMGVGPANIIGRGGAS